MLANISVVSPLVISSVMVSSSESSDINIASTALILIVIAVQLYASPAAYVLYFDCKCVCMYVRMYECMYVCVYLYVCVRIYECMFVCIYVGICVGMYVCRFSYLCACMYACTCACIYPCTYVCMYVCMYVCKKCAGV